VNHAENNAAEEGIKIRRSEAEFISYKEALEHMAANGEQENDLW
jgi:hypothetical protein